MRIINIGSVPPPTGGVTYFLKRLKACFDELNIENDLYDISGLNYKEKKSKGIICGNPAIAFLNILFKSKKSVVIFHSIKPLVLLAANILRIRHKVVITLHGEGLFSRLSTYGKFKNAVILFMLKNIDGFLCDSSDIKSKLNKINGINKDNILCFIPFIKSLKIIQINDKRIFKLKNECNYMIFFYQYKWNMHNGELLYGADLMIDAFIKLNSSGIKVGLIFLCPNHTENTYYTEFCTKIKEYGLQNKIVFIFNTMEELGEIYKISDVHIRATNTDGGAVTVYESLMYGVPAIASDCVPRAEGCVLFKNRDVQSLYEVTKEVLLNIENYKSNLNTLSISQQNISDLIDFYEGL